MSSIEEAISKMARQKASVEVGTATNIREAEELCDVEIAGKAPAKDARLSIATDKGSGWLVVPKEGSNVVVVWVDGVLPVVVAIGEVDKIVYKKGERGGLINIGDLVEKFNGLVESLNSLVQVFNSHTHIASAQGSATAPTTTPAQQAQRLNEDDIKDDEIKH